VWDFFPLIQKQGLEWQTHFCIWTDRIYFLLFSHVLIEWIATWGLQPYGKHFAPNIHLVKDLALSLTFTHVAQWSQRPPKSGRLLGMSTFSLLLISKDFSYFLTRWLPLSKKKKKMCSGYVCVSLIFFCNIHFIILSEMEIRIPKTFYEKHLA